MKKLGTGICNPESEREVERREEVGKRRGEKERERERETGRTLRGGGEEVLLLTRR